MSVEVPREVNIDYNIQDTLTEILKEVDGTLQFEGRKSKAFVNHITHFLDAINTTGDKRLLQRVKESRQRLIELGVSQDMISGSEVVAARAVIENLAEKLAIYRQDQQAV